MCLINVNNLNILKCHTFNRLDLNGRKNFFLFYSTIKLYNWLKTDTHVSCFTVNKNTLLHVFSSPEAKVQASFSDYQFTVVCPSFCELFTFPSSPESMDQFQPNKTKSTSEGIQVCSNERPCPFPSGYYNKIAKCIDEI